MIIDGWIVPEDLSITFANGKQNAVDVIAGFNKDEHTSLGGNAAFRDTMAWAHAPLRRAPDRDRQARPTGTPSRTSRRSSRARAI